MTTLYNKIKANCPNIEHIKYAWAEIRGLHEINTDEGNSTYFDPFYIHNLMLIIAERYGYEYMGWIGWPAFMRPAQLYSDNVHPNDDGYKTLSAAFKSAFEGSLEYYPWDLYKTMSCGISSSATAEVAYCV